MNFFPISFTRSLATFPHKSENNPSFEVFDKEPPYLPFLSHFLPLLFSLFCENASFRVCRSSAMELVHACGRRSMWGELQEVADSGILGERDTLYKLVKMQNNF